MIVIMCGLPFSGKSTVVNALFDRASHYIIRPDDFIPENTMSLNADMQRSIKIEAYNISIEKLQEYSKTLDESETVVLDMCNRDYSVLNQSFVSARKHGHKIITIFVHTSLTNCKARAPKPLENSVFTKYIDAFHFSLPKFKKLSDSFIIVQNDEPIEVVAVKLADVRQMLCHNTKITTSTT